MLKLFYYIAWASIVGGIILTLLVTYWMVYPYNPLVFKQDKLEIITKKVKQNGDLVFISDYCKYMDLSASLSREFINSLVFVTPPVISNRETGCHRITVSMHVPEELPIGKYYLQNTYTYKVNPIRTITITHISEEFEVL